MDPDTDVCQTEQPQIRYSVDFTAEQSSAMGWDHLCILLPVGCWIGRVSVSGTDSVLSAMTVGLRTQVCITGLAITIKNPFIF